MLCSTLASSWVTSGTAQQFNSQVPNSCSCTTRPLLWLSTVWRAAAVCILLTGYACFIRACAGDRPAAGQSGQVPGAGGAQGAEAVPHPAATAAGRQGHTQAGGAAASVSAQSDWFLVDVPVIFLCRSICEVWVQVECVSACEHNPYCSAVVGGMLGKQGRVTTTSFMHAARKAHAPMHCGVCFQ